MKYETPLRQLISYIIENEITNLENQLKFSEMVETLLKKEKEIIQNSYFEGFISAIEQDNYSVVSDGEREMIKANDYDNGVIYFKKNFIDTNGK